MVCVWRDGKQACCQKRCEEVSVFNNCSRRKRLCKTRRPPQAHSGGCSWNWVVLQADFLQEFLVSLGGQPKVAPPPLLLSSDVGMQCAEQVSASFSHPLDVLACPCNAMTNQGHYTDLGPRQTTVLRKKLTVLHHSRERAGFCMACYIGLAILGGDPRLRPQ